MTDVDRLRELLRVSNAPMVNEGIETTLHFFATVLNTDPFKWVEYIRGIDFHNPVSVRPLVRGTPLVQYKAPGPSTVEEIVPFAYFTAPGVSPYHLGWSRFEWERRDFNVLAETSALASTASSLSFGPRDEMPKPGRKRDSVSRIGGGLQYIISRAQSPMLLRVGEVKRAH